MKRPEKQNLIDAILSRRGNITKIAELLQTSRKSVGKWIKDYELQDVVDESRNARIDDYEHHLDKAAKEGNVSAIIFFLKTQGKERGYVERQEYEIQGGSIPIDAWIKDQLDQYEDDE